MPGERGSESLGAKLRRARESRGATLDDVAKATKISRAILNALERDDASKLPGGIFSRAFVKAYAAEVGLSPDEALRDFVEQFPTVSQTAALTRSVEIEDNTSIESNRRMASAVVWLGMVSLALASVVLYFGVTGRPEPPVPVSDSDVESSRPATDAVTAAGRGNEPVVARSSSGGGEDVAASTAGVGPAADRLSVDLRAAGPCWVRVVVDGRLAFQRLLQPGDREQLDVRNELVLTAGDAGALTVLLNGLTSRPLGRPGAVVTTRYNLTNFRSYLADH